MDRFTNTTGAVLAKPMTGSTSARITERLRKSAAKVGQKRFWRFDRRPHREG